MWNFLKRSKVKAMTSSSNNGWQGWLNTGSRTSAGQCINNNSALAISTVYDCIRIISEDLAKLPLPVFQQLSSGIKETRKDHPLYNVLNWKPNPEMSAMSFRNSIISHAVGWGNGYAEKVRDQNGNIKELWLLPPDRVKTKRRENGDLYYEIKQPNNTTVELGPDKIFHIPGFGYDGVQGYNVVQIARESLGLAAAAEMFGSKFFGNGAKTSLALTFPNGLSEKAHTNLQKSIERQVTGENQHRILLVEEGGKVETMALSQKDSQYLETREFSIEEICRWFRVPPHKVADLRRATFSNIEEQNIDYVTDTLVPWFIRTEQAVHNQLFTEDDQDGGYYVKHNANALLRGNSKSRAEFYGKGITDGWMTRNEARGFEDLNPLDGLDEPLIPLNMETVTQSEQRTEATNDAFIEDVAGRIATAEERGLSTRVAKADDDRDRFNEWVNAFYGKQESYVLKCLSPLDLDADAANRITIEGILSVAMSDHPAEHIKNWNRKQEIIDIIQEALSCIHK